MVMRDSIGLTDGRFYGRRGGRSYAARGTTAKRMLVAWMRSRRSGSSVRTAAQSVHSELPDS
jgi:hypothetical protein